MSRSAHAMGRPRSGAGRGRTVAERRRLQRQRRRRRLGLFAFVAVVGVLGAVLVPRLDHAVRAITLPLEHEDIIRQQAADKHLDPSLIAGVIYAESKFRDQTSTAGAKGLMQITPATAHFIAGRSGGTAFETADLSTPQVNIAYGAWYLRYLLRRYDDDETLALAAYNAGEGNVDRWRADAARHGRIFHEDDIPFPETRAYVDRVEQAKRDYRANYPSELGL